MAPLDLKAELASSAVSGLVVFSPSPLSFAASAAARSAPWCLA